MNRKKKKLYKRGHHSFHCYKGNNSLQHENEFAIFIYFQVVVAVDKTLENLFALKSSTF